MKKNHIINKTDWYYSQKSINYEINITIYTIN